MTLDEKIFHFLLGCAIGFIAGYIVRYLQQINEKQEEIKEELDYVKEELDEVDDIVKRQRGEDGFMRFPIIADFAVLIALIVTVWAAVATGNVNAKLKESQEELGRTQTELAQTQDRLARITSCNISFQAKTIRALNERTRNTTRAARANVELQRSQSAFLGVLRLKPPATPAARRDALERYFEALTEFVAVNGNIVEKAKSNPYPTNEAFSDCLTNEN